VRTGEVAHSVSSGDVDDEYEAHEKRRKIGKRGRERTR
jgi:hypothetical protein